MVVVTYRFVRDKDNISKFYDRSFRQRSARANVCHRGTQDGLSRAHVLAG
jgi:hypothetical protein